MQIDLNDPQDFTLDNVRKLIASKDDSANRQIRVTKAGVAYLSDVVGNQETDDLAFRIETLIRGNGYTGAEAAADDSWVRRIYNALQANWPKPQSSYIDVF
jgi:hypothetical protein